MNSYDKTKGVKDHFRAGDRLRIRTGTDVVHQAIYLGVLGDRQWRPGIEAVAVIDGLAWILVSGDAITHWIPGWSSNKGKR